VLKRRPRLPPRPTRAALAKALGGHLPRRRARVGLLGGSFNPAHRGHAHVALQALRRLKLDEVWLLVSPQNPLKDSKDMAPLERRLASARRIARHPRLKASAMETLLGTRRTADTLAQLERCFPGVRFVWIMGADNLQQIHHWGRWKEIFHRVGVAVFDRPSYSLGALSAKAAQRFAKYRLQQAGGWRVARERPPAWVFMRIKLIAQSATALRARADRKANNHGKQDRAADARPAIKENGSHKHEGHGAHQRHSGARRPRRPARH